MAGQAPRRVHNLLHNDAADGYCHDHCNDHLVGGQAGDGDSTRCDFSDVALRG
ncbi:MAG: hypothetical protein ACRDQH_02925 [Pseudonocardiaceae bacterium]